MVELKAKVGTRGQVVIPKAIREECNIHANDTVSFHVKNDHIEVRLEEDVDILERLFSRFPEKLPEPESSDLDELAYSQIEERLKLQNPREDDSSD